MTTKIIHFDSVNSVNNPTTIIDPVTSNQFSTYHSFNTNFALPSQLQGMTRIKLKSIEMPLSFCNIRSDMSPFSFTYTNILGTTYSKTVTQALPEATYTDIYAVVAALKTYMTTSSGLSSSLMTGETVPVFSVTTINRDLRVCYTMQIYPSSTFTITETFFTKKLLGYVKATDNLAVTSTTRYFKGGVYKTDAQFANYIAVNNSLTIRNDITTATTANSLTTYFPSVSTALITQQYFKYSLLSASYAINGSTTFYIEGILSTTWNSKDLPTFVVANTLGGTSLIGNTSLYGYQIRLSVESSGLVDIFSPNTTIVSITSLNGNNPGASKWYAAIELSKPFIASYTVDATHTYQIDIVANNLMLSTTTFTNPFNINYDTYLNMTLQNLPVVTTNNNQMNCTFKIPLNSQGNIVYLNGESNSFEQVATIDNTHFILDKLTIVFTDRRGNAIQPNYGNYSFSLGFEFGSTGTGTTNGNSGTPSGITTSAGGTTATGQIHYFQEFM